MSRWIALIALLLSACATETASSTETPAAVWLAPDHPLYEAQKAWGMPLPSVPEVVLDFGTREQVGIACGHPGSSPTGCTMLDGKTLLFAAGETPARLAVSMLHEMGHLLAGPERGHIEDAEHCPGDARGEFIMCTYSNLTPELTDADFAFVLSAR